MYQTNGGLRDGWKAQRLKAILMSSATALRLLSKFLVIGSYMRTLTYFDICDNCSLYYCLHLNAMSVSL